MEIEAKFAIPDAAVFHAHQAPTRLGPFSLTNTHIRQVHDTYLDTPDRTLYRAGYGFRQRKQESGWLMTLNQIGGVEGTLRRREELELALPEACPPAAWPPSPLRSRVLELIGDRAVQPLFALDQTRIVRSVTAQDIERALREEGCEVEKSAIVLEAPIRALGIYEIPVKLLPEVTATVKVWIVKK